MLSPTNPRPNCAEYAMPNTNGWTDAQSSVPARSPQYAIKQIHGSHGHNVKEVEVFVDTDTPVGRLYAFKLNFAKHMVEVHGSPRDYERLRKVQEEALDALA